VAVRSHAGPDAHARGARIGSNECSGKHTVQPPTGGAQPHPDQGGCDALNWPYYDGHIWPRLGSGREQGDGHIWPQQVWIGLTGAAFATRHQLGGDGSALFTGMWLRARRSRSASGDDRHDRRCVLRDRLWWLRLRTAADYVNAIPRVPAAR
jgi:hypothetical protein